MSGERNHGNASFGPSRYVEISRDERDRLQNIAEWASVLADALDQTHWSSWQSTHKFMPALEALQAALSTHDTKKPGATGRPQIGHKSGCVTINCPGCGTDFYSEDHSPSR